MTEPGSPHETRAAIPHGRVAVLGLITIAAYGGWFYSFGVLLDPIISDTGWSEAAVAAVFGSSAVIAAFGSLLGGWLLDRLGSRLVFAAGAILGAGSLLIAAGSTRPAVFAVAGAVAGGVLASLGFYHVTQTTAVRISPGDSDRAIAVLTIWGAFASAIYIPLTAWLVTRFDWRFTLRVIAVTVFAAFMAGALLIQTRHRRSSPPPIFWAVGAGLRQPRGRRLMVSQVLAGLGVGTILVYQVPVMTAAGLTLAAASFWAGFRGFAQLGGRLPLMPMVRRLGVATSLRLAYGAIAVGALALGLADNNLLAAVYAVVAGFGIGAVSPLIGMYSRDVFGEKALGTAMGLVGLGFLLANAAGPILAAIIAESTGSRALPVLISSVIVALAAVVVRTGESSGPTG